MHRYLIALGSNMGDRFATLTHAVRSLESELGPIQNELGPIQNVSSVYATAPVGAAKAEFLNAALVLSSSLEPRDVMQVLLRVEKHHGRVRDVLGGDRTLDCDLILCRTAQDTYPLLNEPDLILPHPRALERDFVLVPAAEVAPTWRHPLSGKTLAEECLTRGFHLTPMKEKRLR